MRWHTAVVRWACTLVTLFLHLSFAAREKVCADLVGTGGTGVRIWPTLRASPLRLQHHLTFRLVQINWEAEEIFEGDWVGIFPKDPRPPMRRVNPLGLPVPVNSSVPIWDMPAPLYWNTPYSTEGQVTSNVTQGRVELQMLTSGGCVGVWAAFIRNGLAIAAECLASHPNWMWQNRDVLGSRSLRSLVIPGTHNSGSFSLKDEDDVVSAWVVCQDEDILSQLLYGIRYLDLRVAYYPNTPELLWVNHDLVQWRPLAQVLQDVQAFLLISKDPIIIDIHRTPVGFEFPEAVPLLLSLMNNTFGKDFLPDRLGPQVTLDQIWSIGKHVIFAYIDAEVADEEDWIWPPIPQTWANAQKLEGLQHYLDGQMTLRQSSPRIWAAMAHLTPSFWDVIIRSHIGVRGMADHVNRPVTSWLRERWAHLANIVATDFFLGNNVINLAIRTNLALSVCPSGSTHRPRYTYKSPSFLRRSTEQPGRLMLPRINFSEAMRSQASSTTLSPLLVVLSTSLPTSHKISPSEENISLETNARSLEPIRVVGEPNKTYKKFDRKHKDKSIISPIHSLLDIFGFNTTNTSTIASRLISQEQGHYEDDDLFTNDQSQGGGRLFPPSQPARQLSLIFETSMSIALQGDDDDEEEEPNSGDIPFVLSSTPETFENQGESQDSNIPLTTQNDLSKVHLSNEENESVSFRYVDSLSKNNISESQPSEGERRISGRVIAPHSLSISVSPQSRHLSGETDDFS